MGWRSIGTNVRQKKTLPAESTISCQRSSPISESNSSSVSIAVLLVEQNARMSLEIADHAYVLDDGAIVYSWPAADLAVDDARVQALGRSTRTPLTPTIARNAGRRGQRR
jgi:hypothetical protein